MDSKTELINNIKEWVKLDNEIRQIKKEEKSRKIKQKVLTDKLMSVMKENKIDEFDTKTGKLSYQTKNVKKPITKKNLMNILSKYYKGDLESATSINDFIMDNREERTVESISMKIND